MEGGYGMTGWEAMAGKAAAKALGKVILGGALVCLKHSAESMYMQYEITELQDTYHAREKEAMMRAAVALMQTGRLDASNTKIIMRILEGNAHEYGF